MFDALQFIARLLAQPKTVGAIAPSSRALGRAMAAQIPNGASGPILELGPGTGVVTRAILARGIAPARLTAVEYDADFATMVAARNPGVRVIKGDAFNLDNTLGGRDAGTYGAILSSMPLVNFPMPMRRALLTELFRRLEPGAPFIQFSYRWGPPVPPPAGASVVQAAFILFNLPPARVWVYRKL